MAQQQGESVCLLGDALLVRSNHVSCKQGYLNLSFGIHRKKREKRCNAHVAAADQRLVDALHDRLHVPLVCPDTVLHQSRRSCDLTRWFGLTAEHHVLLSLLADQLRVAQSKQRALSKLSALGRQPTLRHGLQRLGYRRVLQQGLASGWEESELSQALRVVLLAPCLELRLHIRVRVLRVEKQSIDAAHRHRD